MHSRSPERASAMKPNIKKLSILGLAGIFLLSAMLCCCFTNIVEAEEPAPFCHQTSHDAESSKTAKKCDCDHSVTTAQKATFLKNKLVQVSTKNWIA